MRIYLSSIWQQVPWLVLVSGMLACVPAAADNANLLDGGLLDEEPVGAGSEGSVGDLLEPGDRLGSEPPDAPREPAGAGLARGRSAPPDAAGQAHLALFAERRYPSASTCQTCHPRQYAQWSVSQHAYAQLSPVYMAMQNKINAGTSSTNGDFCIRCHNQVGMNMGESPFMSNLDRHPTSREGISCVVCHRLDQEYGKVSGRVALNEGGLLTAVSGPTGNAELKRVLDNRHRYRVVTDPDASGRKIHAEVGHFPYLGESGFCGICHDVNLFDGFRLEEAFSDYKRSPAPDQKISCQDCHMGKTQGRADGYEYAAAAQVGRAETRPRRVTNHFFAGPDYSVLHPGIFPHNADAGQLATLAEWLQFDHAAGWGTDAFENQLPPGTDFPERWQSVDDRYDARKIIAVQLERLQWAAAQRLEVLRNAFALDPIRVTRSRESVLKFEIAVRNITDGHSAPTGFDAERLVWLDVRVTDAVGKRLFASGDLDPNGDLRDTHSLYVQAGELPLDRQLFSLQSRFLTRNLRGGEREQVLAVNYSLDPLPFIRPSTASTILTGQPASARKHRYVMPPGSTRLARYRLGREQLSGASPYRIHVQLKAGMVPVNLIHEIQDVGFDFNMSPRAVADAVVAGHQVLDQQVIVTGAVSAVVSP